MFEEFCLPNGKVATSAKDVDEYLKRTGTASASDFSGEYLKNRRYFLQKAQDADLRSDFIFNYKKEIWK